MKKNISFSKTILPDDVEDTYENRIEIRYIDSFKLMASSIALVKIFRGNSLEK